MNPKKKKRKKSSTVLAKIKFKKNPKTKKKKVRSGIHKLSYLHYGCFLSKWGVFSFKESQFLIHHGLRDGKWSTFVRRGRRKRACTRVSSSALADGAKKKEQNSLSLETDLDADVGAREKSVYGSCKREESGESKIVGFGGEIRKLLDLKGKVGKKETEGFVEVVIVVVVVVEGLLYCKSWRGGKEVGFSSLLQ